MATTARTKIGRMRCPNAHCESNQAGNPDFGQLVAVYRTEKGALSCSCQVCDGRETVRPFEAKYKHWEKVIQPMGAQAEPAPAAKGKNFLGMQL